MSEFPPMVPDRPGRYLLLGGNTASIYFRAFTGMWRGEINGVANEWYRDGSNSRGADDIVARAPDDKAWCIEQARALATAHGYKVINNIIWEALTDERAAASDLKRILRGELPS